MTQNLIYDFHSSYDEITLNAVNRILKLNSLKKSREYFGLDFLSDIGIINLLRRNYLETGDFKDTFYLFQDSRLDPKSHRYESLFALLIITAVGTVIGGIILDIYQNQKNKIEKIIPKSIIKKLGTLRNKRLKNKFCNMNPDDIMADILKLKNGYIARLMYDNREIKYNQYIQLIGLFIEGKNNIDKEVLKTFNEYKLMYNESSNRIDEEQILLAIESYSRGTLIKFLEQKDIEIPYDKDIKTAHVVKGLPASSGYAKTKTWVYSDNASNKTKVDNKVLCIDSNVYSPQLFDIVCDSIAVVTWNCGMTGHIPLLCRGLRKGCIIINKNDAHLFKDNDDIMLSGGQGIIYTGLFVPK